MTSLDLITTVTEEPTASPRSSAVSLVMLAVICCPPPISTLTMVVTLPTSTEPTVPASWFRADNRTTNLQVVATRPNMSEARPRLGRLMHLGERSAGKVHPPSRRSNHSAQVGNNRFGFHVVGEHGMAHLAAP